MKVYDCFLFYNELDILEIRLEELYDQVDYFVILESDLTFQGKQKEYFFETNKQRFSRYLDKIRHIKIDNNPTTNDPWVREKYQRKCLAQGLYDAEPEDRIIVGDCDEIVRADVVANIKSGTFNSTRLILNLAQFNFRLNYFKVHPAFKHCQVTITKFSQFKDPQREREVSFFWTPKPPDTVLVEHGGWHFTFFGNDQHCLNKIASYSHVESNIENVRKNLNIDYMIANRHGIDRFSNPKDDERFEPVLVDEYFPKAVRNNLDRWKNMIVEGATLKVTDVYKI